MVNYQTERYRPEDYGKEEVELKKKFDIQLEDAKNYFITILKPRLDRSYKLIIADNTDRAKQIQKWQSNITVPYIQAVIETLMPRVVDARPEFTVQGRTTDDQPKGEKLQQVTDYTWEIAGMDIVSEDFVRSAVGLGTGYIQAFWKKDVRTQKFLKTKDLNKKKYEWVEEEKTFYDAPCAEWVDNYGLWYDWHNIPYKSKQFWFKRLILTGEEIKRKYPSYDKKRLAMAMNSSGDLTDYAAIRYDVKFVQEQIIKGADYNSPSSGIGNSIYQSQSDPDLKMHEVFEWWRPFADSYSVFVNGVPILKGGEIPNPYDFKEAPFIPVQFLRLPGESEGYGLAMILENLQIYLNMIKNQRIDAATLSIHKMWIVNPLANVNKKELVSRPMGIIYSTDPNGVKEVQFSDIKPSSYKEEELMKMDMRYACGVDDFSMGVGGGASSATEVRHLRESTLERVRLFINHLGDSYAKLMRYWISMYRQFYTKSMIIRIIGEDGQEMFPLVEKDDLMGEFDYKATVIPSIAGKNDVDKKQGMDLFQLLINLPFVDPQKLTSKVLHSWNWNLNSVAKSEPNAMPSQPGMSGTEGVSPEMAGTIPQPEGELPMPMETGAGSPELSTGQAIPMSVARQALASLGTNLPQTSQYAEAGAPINLLSAGALPPTVSGVPQETTNPRGLNRGGAVNTNIPQKAGNGPEAQILNQAENIQS